jgi:hypothetical protein
LADFPPGVDVFEEAEFIVALLSTVTVADQQTYRQ